MKVLLLALNALSAVCLVAVSTPTFAQQTGPPLKRASHEHRITLELSTGAWTADGEDDPDDCPSVVCYTNTDASGFYSTGAENCGDRWLDWGVLPPSTNDIVTGFTFAYATSMLDTSLGGPGADACVSFYEGTTGFCADSGTQPIASFSFTGLPGDSGLCTSPDCWGPFFIVDVDLSGGFEFRKPAGPFGFSFVGAGEDGTGGAPTGPMLCYVGDGSGGPDENGGEDAFDIWVPDLNGFCSGTFFFGGPPWDFASWYLKLEVADEENGTQASVTSRTGGNNPSTYVATRARIGGMFTAVLDLQQTGHAMGAVLGYASPISLPLNSGQVLLVNVADLQGELLALPPGPGTGPNGEYVASTPMPLDVTVCGKTIYSQGVHFGGVQPFALTNSQDLLCGF